MKLYRDIIPAASNRLCPGKIIPPRTLFSHSNDEAEVLCRERTSPVYLGDTSIMSRMLGRFKFLTDTSDIGFAPHIVMDGYWEMWLTRWMVETVQQGWTALDIGANYGYYSVLLAELVGADGRLLAFEPNPPCAKATDFSLGINGFGSRSRVHEVALSSSSGHCSFYVPFGEPKNGHLVFGDTHATGTDYADDEGGLHFKVPIAPLDSIAESLERVDFVKIDAEGAEQGIFEGMQETIARHNPLIVMEYNAIRGEAEAFAGQLKETYPNARYLDEDGSVNALDFGRLALERLGQDWLLILKQ